jgi:hypothetical protein
MPLYTIKNVEKNLEVAFYFIHIPKCAGTTVETLFEQLKFHTFLSLQEMRDRDLRKYLKLPPAHYDISLLEKIFHLDKIYSFAIVRNPYDRILSDYKWAKTKTNNTQFFSQMNFEEFCNYCFNNYAIDSAFLGNHVKPQHKFVSKNVNKVFKLENGLETAIEEVFTDIGINLNEKLVLNKLNSSEDEEINISQKAKDSIYEFYEEDFKMFGYEK